MQGSPTPSPAESAGPHHILDELSWRGLVAQHSDEAALREHLSAPGQTLYCGFDPTASSLHVGSLVPLLALRRFQLAGHVPIAVLGGGTGLVGDPSGKAEERRLQTTDVVEEWKAAIREQMGRIVDLQDGRAQLVDNFDWLGKLSAIELLRDIGKHFSVNAMIAKESVSARLDREGVGISYTEFSYMVLQAYDYLHLYEAFGCRLQVGGSDQWGNITAGMDLIRRKHAADAHVLTFPLLTTSSGKKFGKTEAGTVWLDAARTSPYHFYQYWINTEDADVARFLRYFTFLGAEEIGELERALAEKPEAREAQRRLAFEVTSIVHGRAAAERARATSQALFEGGELSSVDAGMLEAALADAPRVALAGGEPTPSLTDLLIRASLFPSKGEARRALKAGGVYCNDTRVTEEQASAVPESFLHGRFLVLRRGKKQYALVVRG